MNLLNKFLRQLKSKGLGYAASTVKSKLKIVFKYKNSIEKRSI